MVDAAEGPAAALAPLGPDAIPARARGGSAAPGPQSSADGPSAPAPQAAPQETALRPHQAGYALETPHPSQDRPLGCQQPRLHRGGPRRPLRRVRRRGVPPLAQPHRHPHHLGGDPRRHGQGPGRRAGGARGNAHGAALHAHGHRLRQRLRVHQRPPLPGPAGATGSSSRAAARTRKTTTPMWSRRTGPMSASSWATSATTPRRPSRP